MRNLLIRSVVLAVLASVQSAQTQALESIDVPVDFDSGWVQNTSTQPAVVASFPVTVARAPWLRLHFSEIALSGDPTRGTGAYLRVTSQQDGAEQRLNELHVRQWQKSTAYFNGDTVLVEIVAFPGTGSNRVVLDMVVAGKDFVPQESQCGATDDRVLSFDNRSARLLPVGCTSWIIDDACNCMLTAGHCTFAAQTVQFNVPLSTSSGQIVNPPPEDQYSVDPASIQSNGGQGIGNDYAYLGVFPNSNTGLTPVEAYGSAFTLAAPPPFQNGQQIRITGFGVDFNDLTATQVQQTNAGPRVNATGTTVSYMTDTEGGNSGSPVIDEATGNAIGIHTHGGCSSTAGNSGTGANHSGLSAFLAAPTGVCASSDCGGGGGGGTIVKYGEGLGGSNIGDLDSLSNPVAGGQIIFDVTGIPSGTSGLVWISFTQTSTARFGGTLLADLSTAPVRIAYALSAGSASITFAIPTGTTGLTVFSQSGVRDLTQSQGIALTNGLQITIG